MKPKCVVLTSAMLFAMLGPFCFAADTTQPAPAQGILPVPVYSNDLWHTAYLTGDWGGARTDLANQGIQFGLNFDQYFQSVTRGGFDHSNAYGGHLKYNLSFDLMRMGVLPGAVVKVQAETRYGRSVNGSAGSILPVNTDASFPLTDALDDNVPIAVTALNYTQFLGPKFAVLLGKVDTLEADLNEFASGDGVNQFMNSNFIFNPSLALRLPYSSLAAGMVWLPVQEQDHSITVTSTVISTTDSSTTTGFGDVDKGTTWTTEADFQYRIANLPGGQNVGFLYSFNQDFGHVGSRVVLGDDGQIAIGSRDYTWAVYWSTWQYLFMRQQPTGLVNLANGGQDYEGIGLFARAGFADQETNPLKFSISGGLGGRGLIPTRENDTYGVGYYYTKIQTTRLADLADLRDEGMGFEAYYNIAITPAAHFTLDAQVDQPVAHVDNAVILGMRLDLNF